MIDDWKPNLLSIVYNIKRAFNSIILSLRFPAIKMGQHVQQESINKEEKRRESRSSLLKFVVTRDFFFWHDSAAGRFR